MKTYLLAAGALVFGLVLSLRYLTPMGGDALSQYDYFFFQANHITQHGSLAYWDPYLYIGQRVYFSWLIHFVTSPDLWLTWVSNLLGAPLSFASIFSISRGIEWLSTFAVSFLLGRLFSLHLIASFLLGSVICISFVELTQIWPANFSIQWMWLLYFILRFQKNEKAADAFAMTLSVIYMFHATKIVGLMVWIGPLLIILVHPSIFRLFRRPRVLLPMGLIFMAFLAPEARMIKFESDGFHYAGRRSGSYLSHRGEAAERFIRDRQSQSNPPALDLKSMVLQSYWSHQPPARPASMYFVRDIGGYGGLVLHLLAIYGIFIVRGRLKWRILACLIFEVTLGRFPTLLTKLPLPDFIVFIFNIRYFTFLFGPAKVFTAILAILGLSRMLEREAIEKPRLIGAALLCGLAAGLAMGSAAGFVATVVLLGITTIQWRMEDRIKFALAILLFSVSMGELLSLRYRLISLHRPGFEDYHLGSTLTSAQDRRTRYAFRPLEFHATRTVNPIQPKYAFQNSSHLLDTPLPVLEGGRPAAWHASFMQRSYRKLLDDFGPESANDLNGVNRGTLEFFPRSPPAPIDFPATAGDPIEGTTQDIILIPIGESEEDDLPEPVTIKLASIQVAYFDANRLEVDIKVDTPGLLRWSIFADEDWSCEIDGDNTAILLVDHCFQAVEIDAGDHHIEFRFRPIFTRLLTYWIALLTLVTFAWRLWVFADAIRRSPTAGARGDC